MRNPIEMKNMNKISKHVTTCLILHNVCVSDHVMHGDVNARYNPAFSIEDDFDEEALTSITSTIPLEVRELLCDVAEEHDNRRRIGIRKFPPRVQCVITSVESFRDLQNVDDHYKLRDAVMNEFDGKRKRRRCRRM